VMKNPVRPRFPGVKVPGILTRLGPCLSCLLLATTALGAADNAQVVNLSEVSVLSGALSSSEFIQGQRAMCESNAMAAVKTYPAFKSKKPLFGSVRFDADFQQPETGQLYYFALDEAGGTGKGYNRFYFDLNRDLNLANDPPLEPRPLPESARLPWTTLKHQTGFELLRVPFDFGAGEMRPVDILPRLIIWTNDYAALTFVRNQARKGEIRVAGQRYAVELGHDYVIGGRFDQPMTALRLQPQDNHGAAASWWGGDRLTAFHKIGGTFYSFAATPAGDHLTANPYAGDLGRFEIGPGKRALKKMEVRGSLAGSRT
jgi:hypothetical protein